VTEESRPSETTTASERSAAASSTGARPDWYPDPMGRFEFRYFNGERWTSDVSVNGAHYIDPVYSAAVGTQTITAPPTSAASTSTRLAMLSLVFGAIGVVTAWLPLLFAVGTLAAIASIVLAIIALQRARNGRGAGRNLAAGGLVLGVLGLLVSIFGLVLTVRAIRDFSEFSDPGPTQVDIATCSIDGISATSTGTITNLDDAPHTYVITIEFTRNYTSVGIDETQTIRVQPGDQAAFTARASVGVMQSEDLQCRLTRVSGPYPFGFGGLD